MSEEGVDYYIVFCDSDIRWLKWLKPGFRHCFVMRREFGQLWTVISDSRKALEVQTYLIEDYPTPESYARPGSTIVHMSKQAHNGYRGHICFFSCVEVVKAVLGIKKPFILTPYQLYRWVYGRRFNTEREGQARARSQKATAAN